MTLSFAVNGVTLPEEAVLINPGGVGSLPSSAWYGETATATIVVDDPFADYDFRSWEVFTADESAATGKTRVFTGWIFSARISRGTYRHGAARVWELEIVDQNAALGFNFFRANSAQRPAETDVARVEFILESEPMAWTPVVAGPLTNLTDNPRNLQSDDMVRTTPVEGLTTTAGFSGKAFHVFWSHDDAELQLYYDQIAAYPAATASISNDIADAGADVYYPFVDASLVRAGDQIYTGELIDFVGGSAFGESATTIDRLSPTPLSPVSFKRAFMRRSDAIGRLETANAIIQQDLASQATEENTITVTIRVPAANVNDIEAGQRVTVKFTHLVGYESDTEVNCIRRDVVPTDGRVDMYDITLELSDKAKLRELDGGDPDDFPPDPVVCDVDDIAIVQWDNGALAFASPGVLEGASWPAPPTQGNLLICAWTAHAQQGLDVGAMDGWGKVPAEASFAGTGGSGGNIQVFWKLAEATEDTTPQATGSGFGSGNIGKSQNYLIEVSGVDSIDVVGTDADFSETETASPGITVTPTAGLVAFILTVQEWNTISSLSGTPKAGVTELVEERNIQDNGNPVRWIGYMAVDGTTGSYDVNPTTGDIVRWASVTTTFYCSASDPDAPCIAAGQPSPEDEAVTPTPDGVETEFFTRCPFADETLHVRVDATNQDGAIVSYDGAAGSFILGFAPTPTERITVNYLGRP